MRKLLTLPLIAALSVGFAACDGQPTEPTADASLQSVARSHGATGVFDATAVYRAVNSTAAANHGLRVGERVGTLSVTDDGAALTVVGSASGLDAAGVYVSLFYDRASPAQGPDACEPGRKVGTGTGHPLSLTIAQMEIGSAGSIDLWDVDASGNASLGPTSTLEYVSAGMIGTVSIRDARVNNGFGPEAVVACGVVRHDDAR